MKTPIVSSSATSWYQGILKDHHRHPRNYGDLHDAAVIRRGSNPLCGDEVEVGLYYDAEIVRQVRFRGRGCAMCIASASLMTEAVAGQSRYVAHQMVNEMKLWFRSRDSDDLPGSLGSLRVLSLVREHPARYQCALLAWDALNDALTDMA